MDANVKQLFTPQEAEHLMERLLALPFEFRSYKRYNKKVSVPRGQLAFTTSGITYNYTQAGGTPTILRFADYPFVESILEKVNSDTGLGFNTVLMNYYRDGADYISAHHDSTVGWDKAVGFATLSFGAERRFVLKSDKERLVIPHVAGSLIYLSYEQNQSYTHSVPKQLTVKEPRVSMTFRKIV